MPQYIAYINRKKREDEDTFIEYYKNTTLGIVEGANIDKAFAVARDQFKGHPEHILLNVVHFKRAMPTQQKIAETLMATKRALGIS